MRIHTNSDDTHCSKNNYQRNHYLGFGKVFHSRRMPKKHSFDMSVYMLRVSLSEDNQQLATKDLRLGVLSKLVVSDYWDGTAQTMRALQDKVIQEWQQRGLAVDAVCLLTNPRTLNMSMNPISVYYCYRADELVGIVAEVTNTPWGERCHYFLCVGKQTNVECTGKADWQNNSLTFTFMKDMHVSPFNHMDLQYEMRFVTTNKKISVVMQLCKDKVPMFDAALNLRLEKLDKQTWLRAFYKKPWITMQILARIYYEALRLLLKGVAFVGHPKTQIKPVNTLTPHTRKRD